MSEMNLLGQSGYFCAQQSKCFKSPCKTRENKLCILPDVIGLLALQKLMCILSSSLQSWHFGMGRTCFQAKDLFPWTKLACLLLSTARCTISSKPHEGERVWLCKSNFNGNLILSAVGGSMYFLVIKLAGHHSCWSDHVKQFVAALA